MFETALHTIGWLILAHTAYRLAGATAATAVRVNNIFVDTLVIITVGAAITFSIKAALTALGA